MIFSALSGLTVVSPIFTVAPSAATVQRDPEVSIEAMASAVVTDVPQSLASFCSMSHWRILSMSAAFGSMAVNASSISEVAPIFPMLHPV